MECLERLKKTFEDMAKEAELKSETTVDIDKNVERYNKSVLNEIARTFRIAVSEVEAEIEILEVMEKTLKE